MKSIFTTKRVTAGLLIVLLVSVWVQLPREGGQGKLSNKVKARDVTVGSIESEFVQIDSPSSVTSVNDADPDVWKEL